LEGNLAGAEVEAVVRVGTRFGESRETSRETVETEEISRQRSLEGGSEEGTSKEGPSEEKPKKWSQERDS
jgi:hypothetical protein